MNSKKIIIAFWVFLSVSLALSACNHETEYQSIDFGYEHYEKSGNTMSFSEKMKLPVNLTLGARKRIYLDTHSIIDTQDLTDPILFYITDQADIVMVVDADTDKQIEFQGIIESGNNAWDTLDTSGFTLTNAKVKKIIRNNSSLSISEDENIWLREEYHVSNGIESSERVIAHTGEEINTQNEESVLEKEPFLSMDEQWQFPLCQGDILIFARVDEDAKKMSVLLVDSRYKFRLNPENNNNYDIVESDNHRFAIEVIEELEKQYGYKLLSFFALNAQPKGASIFPAFIGFSAGMLVCVVPTVIVVIVRRRKARAKTSPPPEE